MININEVYETNEMIEKENLDVRTITMGISLFDCIDSELYKTCDLVYDNMVEMLRYIEKHWPRLAEDIENGNTTPASEFFAELREEYGIY